MKSKRSRHKTARRKTTSHGPVPDGWTQTTIADVTADVPNAVPEVEPDRLWRYADIGSVDPLRNAIVDVKQFRGRDAPSRARRPVHAGDILFSNVRVNLRKIAYVQDPPPVDLCSTGFTVLRSTDAVDSRFLLYAVLRNDFVTAVERTQTGTQYPATSDRHIRAMPFVLPPLPEQKRIAAAIDGMVERIRNTVDRVKAAVLSVGRLRESLSTAAFSGALTESWRPKVGPPNVGQRLKEVLRRRSASLPTHRRRTHPRYLTPDPPDGDGLPELPSIPEHWLWTSIGFVADRIQYGTSERSFPEARGGIPNVGMQNVQGGRITLDNVKYAPQSAGLTGYRLLPGDILFNRTNSPELVGKSAVFELEIPAIFASYLVRIQVERDLANPAFVCQWINSPWGKSWAQHVKTDGVSQSNINSTKLAEMPLPLPPLAEQDEICRRLNDASRRLTIVEERTIVGAGLGTSLTESLLVKAFSGQLVPTEASIAAGEGRSFETAESLLARVMASKGVVHGRRSVERKPKGGGMRVSLSRESVILAVDQMASARFTFADLQSRLRAPYESLKDIVFDILDEPLGPFVQVMDSKKKTICFERRHS